MEQTELEKLVVRFEADISRYEQSLARYSNRTEAAANRAEKVFKDANRRITQSAEQMSRDVRRAIVGIAVAVAGREVIQYEETWRSTVNTLKQYAGVLGDAKVAAADLNAVADDAAVPLASLGSLTGAAARAAKELGKSRTDVLQFVETVSKGAQIANNGAAAVSGALIQLSQAIASPRVQLGEFNSIVEGTPRLAQAFADGIDKAGGSVAKLRQLIAAGDISGEELFAGLLSQTAKVRTEFEGITFGITEAFVRLQNKLTEFIGANEGVQGAVQGVAGAVSFLADNLEAFASAATVAAAVLGGALAGQALVAVVSGFGAVTKGATLATAAVRVFGTVAAVFGGPVPLLIGAIAGAFILLAQNTETAEAAISRAEDSVAGAQEALEILNVYVQKADMKPLEDTAKDAAEEVTGLAAAMRDLTEAMNDATIASFANNMLTVNTAIAEQISVVEELREKLDEVGSRQARAAGLTPSGGAGSASRASRDAERLSEQLAAAEQRLADLTGRQTQLSFQLLGTGGGKEIFDLVAAGDINGAASILRDRLKAIGAEVSESDTDVTLVDEDLIKAANKTLEQLQDQYRATFETEREAIQRTLEERLMAAELSNKSDRDREAARAQAIALAENDLQELEAKQLEQENAAYARERDREQRRLDELARQKEATQAAIDDRDRMYGAFAEIAERDYARRRREIADTITDEQLRTQALKAIDEEYAEYRRQARDQLLGVGDASKGLEGEIERIRLAEEAKLRELKSGLTAQLINEEEYQARRVEIEKQADAEILSARRDATRAQLSGYQGLFENLGEMFKNLNGENSKAARAALAVSRAFGIADSVIKISQASAQVLADPSAVTLPQKIANLSIIAAQGASIVAAISGAKGFATGGRVGGYGGPTSDNQLIRASPGEYIVRNGPAQQYGPLLDAINSGRAVDLGRAPAAASPGLRLVVNNNAPGVAVTPQRNAAGDYELLIEAVATDILKGGGPVAEALQQAYGVNRAAGL